MTAKAVVAGQKIALCVLVGSPSRLLARWGEPERVGCPRRTYKRPIFHNGSLSSRFGDSSSPYVAEIMEHQDTGVTRALGVRLRVFVFRADLHGRKEVEDARKEKPRRRYLVWLALAPVSSQGPRRAARRNLEHKPSARVCHTVIFVVGLQTRLAETSWDRTGPIFRRTRAPCHALAFGPRSS